jgi:hypothetical protein
VRGRVNRLSFARACCVLDRGRDVEVERAGGGPGGDWVDTGVGVYVGELSFDLSDRGPLGGALDDRALGGGFQVGAQQPGVFRSDREACDVDRPVVELVGLIVVEQRELVGRGGCGE